MEVIGKYGNWSADTTAQPSDTPGQKFDQELNNQALLSLFLIIK